MEKGLNHINYTRNDIYNALQKTTPMPIKKIASKLGVKGAQGVGKMSTGMSVLIKRLGQLNNECAIQHISQKGYVLNERIPAELMIVYSECFKSIQGEGKLMGIPSVFFRTSGCNLRCWFCDTPYTSHAPEVKKLTITEAIKMIVAFDCKHIVITGGEPFIQKHQLMALTGRLKALHKHVTIETNGTIYFDTGADLLSISPKLTGSEPNNKQCGIKWQQMHNERRINSKVLEKFLCNTNYQFKFVITQNDYEAVINEVKYLQKEFGIPSEKIYLMPEGTTANEVQKTQKITINAALMNDWCYSDRLHVRLWDDTRGV